MARPASGTNLTIAELERVLRLRKSEFAKLQLKRAALQRKLDSLEREIERLGGTSNGGSRRVAGARPRNERNLPDTIEVVLRNAGKPLKVAEITDGVLAAGYRSGSANFRGIINQALVKDKRFGQAGRGVYGLKASGTRSKARKSASPASPELLTPA
jgi:hypothetical protein